MAFFFRGPLGHALAAVVLLTSAGSAQEIGNPVAGQVVFQQCAKCHFIGPGSPTTIAGPSLNGVIGRRSGTSGDYNFSPQLRSARLDWEAQALTRFLKSPRGFIPGTQMIFKGLSSQQDIADVIAYIAQFDETGAVKP
ncbi:MAG: c-type cytochrome [Microvirga sp.]